MKIFIALLTSITFVACGVSPQSQNTRQIDATLENNEIRDTCLAAGGKYEATQWESSKCTFDSTVQKDDLLSSYLDSYGAEKPDEKMGLLNWDHYGNYCGGTNSQGGQPVDAVDRCCMNHDRELATVYNAAISGAIVNANAGFCGCVLSANPPSQEGKDYRNKVLGFCGIALSPPGILLCEQVIVPVLRNGIIVNTFVEVCTSK